MKYEFISKHECNMCGATAQDQRLLGRRLSGSQGFSPWKKSGLTLSVFRCSRCSLIYSNPQPIPLDIQDHYGVSPEEYWSQESMAYDHDYFASELRISKKLLDFREGMKALDIGAGVGKCLRALSAAGYEAYGIEPSQSFHQRALVNTGMNAERLQLTTLEAAAFPSEEFDFITFGAVLEHLYDPAAAIGRALKWLRPGGIIQIEVPSSDWLVARLINTYYRARGSEFICNLSPMHPPYHLFEFTLNSFAKNGSLQGYTIAFYQYYVCRTYLPHWVDPIIKTWMRLTNTGMQLCVWLRKDPAAAVSQ